MFQFVTKEQYWAALSEDAFSELKEWATRPPDLKHIEDAVAFQQLAALVDCDIAEMGGGESRILPVLAPRNRCVNVDPLAGEDLGPVSFEQSENIEVIREYVGGQDSSIATNSLDCIFSISVLEHLTGEELVDCYAESARMLRPGGLMVHMIDVYLTDDVQQVLRDRIPLYRSCLASGDFVPIAPPQASDEPTFRCSYATNPDVEMLKWNRIAPSLKDFRRYSQSCVLALVCQRAK